MFDWVLDVVGLALAWLDLIAWTSLFGPMMAAEQWGSAEDLAWVEGLSGRFRDSLALIELPEAVAAAYERVADYLWTLE